MSRGSPFPAFRRSKDFSSSGKVSLASGICKISYAMSITSVISYATANIRSAMSDGGDILRDLPSAVSFFSFFFSLSLFLLLGPNGGPGLREVSVSGKARCQVLSERRGRKPKRTAADVRRPRHAGEGKKERREKLRGAHT